MNCHDAQAVMHGYLDGELDPSVSLQYEQHIGACPACSKALAEQQAMQTAMKADSLYFKAPANLRDRLRASLKTLVSRRLLRAEDVNAIVEQSAGRWDHLTSPHQ